MQNLISFIQDRFKDLNPWQNIKILHSNIIGDILAGITVAIIALPLALAFGEISQLGPVAGIWGAIAGGVVGGLFGGCLVGVSGPTAPKAAQIAAFMSAFVIGSSNEPDLIAAFSIIFISGLILIAISMLKISRFIHYIPYPVIAGFMCGIGIIVILTQINAFFGLEAEKNIHGVFHNFRYIIQNINLQALYVSIPSLIILFSSTYFEKKINFLVKIPSPLVALVIGTAIAYFMNLDIPYIGDKMGTNQEEIFTLYWPDLSRLSEFIFPAFALAGLAVLDSLLSCKVADTMIGKKHSSDRETFGQGMANMAAGFLGGVTTATATMRTVANIKFGGKTPLASIVHGLTLLAILLGLGFLVASIPNACLAAILFKVGIDILDYRILPVLKKIPRADLFIFIVVLFITVYQDLMIAVAIGVALAFISNINEIKSTFNSNYNHKLIPFSESDFVKGLKNNKTLVDLPVSILQPHGPLFFGSMESLLNFYSFSKRHKMLIIDMDYVTMIDLSGIYALEDFIKNLRIKKIEVIVYNTSNSIKETFKKINFTKNFDEDYCKDSRELVISLVSKNFNIN